MIALGLSVVGTGTAAGPTLVVTVMMTVASVLAMLGPFLLPRAERHAGSPPSLSNSPASRSARPATLPPSS
ncbi:MAG: hypothetical protein AAFU38_13260 [Bacteroidota bacterium]